MNPNLCIARLRLERENFHLLYSMNKLYQPRNPSVTYLGITIDQRLTWAPHLRNKIIILNDRFRLLRPLLTSNHVKLPTRLQIYKLFLKRIWAYGIQF